jgi:tRNA (guanine37-N1)-methyltransferase
VKNAQKNAEKNEEKKLQNSVLRFDILSLFPGYFNSPLQESMLKRAIEKDLISFNLIDIRDFTENKHRRVDDTPYGGGPGMVMMADPVAKALKYAKATSKKSKVIYLSASGTPLKAKRSRELAKEEHVILLCGHYEGIDQRVIDKYVDEEICIGDFVLTNGCVAALVLIDSISRFVPGVIGDFQSVEEDSFEAASLDWAHYTRPENFEGIDVPEVLLSGHHKKIAQWRKEQAIKKTEKVRPDLLL